MGKHITLMGVLALLVLFALAVVAVIRVAEWSEKYDAMTIEEKIEAEPFTYDGMPCVRFTWHTDPRSAGYTCDWDMRDHK